MKRFFPFFLFLLLLLCGCRQEAQDTLCLTGDPGKDPYQMNSFFYRSTFNREQEIQITLADDSVLCWDGTSYQLTQNGVTHTYAGLSFQTSTEEVAEGWNFITRFVLESDTGTECIFQDVFFCESPQVFGEVPSYAVEFLTRQDSQSMLSSYQEHSVFERTFSGYNDTREEWVRRWDYKGNLLCEFQVNGYAECFAELEDGGFLAAVTTYPEKVIHVHRYDSLGDLLWKTALSHEETPYLTQLLALPEGIYGFGKIRQPDRADDLYACRISHDGELLDRKNFGGSDFDSIDWVNPASAGFTLYGGTQSRDGDFPLSRNGYSTDFRAEISSELEILSVTEDDHGLFWGNVRGYLDGTPIFFRDGIVQISGKDRLPIANIHSEALFACDDGYAVVRSLAYGNYPYNDPYTSYSPNYRQLIITGYTQDGTPLWQTVGNPYIA